ncbi:hypothetical protein Taro_033068 [Colocasia esculenta]|uniref:Uncharacterized protein n=1 Tax=Colocasia esculenta TaxID=4460 RepID=A0A843WBC7_COLES|nr:hypothetical protein [Colocasia esculenta]
MSSGRGFSAASGSASGPSSVPPPLSACSGQFTPSPPTVAGPSVSAPPAFLAGASTVPEAEDAVSLQEGGGSFFDSTLREVWINGERAPTWMRTDYWEGLCNIWSVERWQETSTTMKVNQSANPQANKHTSGSISFETHQSRLEKDLKRPPTFQEVFDKTHKKKGTDQYISDRAREVVESYSQHMTEKYTGEEEQPQLDPEVWVAASGAPKKGHVYGFRHSMDTSKVLSGATSSGSQATSAFTTPGAPGTSPSEMMGFIQDEISSLECRLVHMMHTQLSDAVQAQLSQAIPQTLSQVSIPPQATPSTSARAPQTVAEPCQIDNPSSESRRGVYHSTHTGARREEHGLLLFLRQIGNAAATSSI